MRLAVLVIGLALAGPAVSQEAFDPQARVTEALQAVRPIALNRDSVDWVAVEARARELAASASDTIDLLPAYHWIVWSLGDNHSFISPSDEQYDEWVRRNGRNRYLPDLPRRRVSNSEFHDRPVSGRDLPLGTGSVARTVVVPAFGGSDADNSFAQSITDALGDGGACGFVVDLRGNSGGNMFPMTAGLWPLLGEGYSYPAIAGPGLEDARIAFESGQMVGYASAGASAAILGALPTWTPGTNISQLPMAVLIDQGVASSGEGTAIALRGREGTRYFGEPTYGVASANDILTLSDGIQMAVTAAYLRDSQGRIYPDGIPPDEPVSTGQGDPRDPDDAVLEAAKAWLAQQPSCRG
ncbi:S41 family peptidase [Brevundimonas sp. AAP58]|uniref:S41 family peptidase n=1 Tax=Brevundimonas sp. AAP58 TaxID=1523422 RepID=UPI0009EAD3E2|nr:S41 family peptidase [Brevundimonas sp. AAP58]